MEKSEQPVGVPLQEHEPASEQSPDSTPERLEAGRESEPSSELGEASTEAVDAGLEHEVTEAAPDAAAASAAPQKDALRMQVERALEDHLWEIYLALPEESRQRFKEGGEICATELRQLAEQPKVRPQNVLALIKNWLKLIPLVNKWFLWQEAKIKTDKFMRLHKVRHEERSMEIT